MRGLTSKASLDLAQVRFQMKSGKTRKGRTLEPEEITALEEKRDRMDAEMRAERQTRLSAVSRTTRLRRRTARFARCPTPFSNA